MKNNTVTQTILSVLATAVALSSCTKDKGPINSEDDMILSTSELVLSHEAQSSSITLKSKGPWHFEDMSAGDGWLTTDATAGSGKNDVININCSENTEAKTRSSYVRFKLDGIYPEYRSLNVVQVGIPVVNMEAFESISAGAADMKGTYEYEGSNEVFTKGGFIISHDGEEEKVYGEMTVVEEKRKNEFTVSYPAAGGKKYKVKAFVEDLFGNCFISANEQPLEIGFSFGSLTCKGELRSHTEAKDVVLLLPYFMGDGQTYHIEVSCDKSGLTVAPADITMSAEGGIIELPVSGKTEETGTATFTVNGLPDFVTPAPSVSVPLKIGGAGQVLYWETFGEGYNKYPDKAYSLTDAVTDGVPITDEMLKFSRTEQPGVVYIKEGSVGIRLEKEADAFSKDPEIGFNWASAGPVLNLKKKENGTFYIHHLNFEGATDLQLQFLVKNPFSAADLDLFYSVNEGESWTPVTWEKIGGDEKTFVMVNSTTTFEGVKDMSLKFVLKSSDGAKKQIDDLRMIGSYL